MNLMFKKKNKEASKITMRYKFVTIVRPGTIGIRKNPYMYNVGQPFFNKTNKLIIKQSYILTVWFYYLHNIHTQGKLLGKPHFYITPKNSSKFTLTRAPMAHKTFSQEQYSFNYYYLGVKFSLTHEKCLDSINKSIFMHLSNRFSKNLLETNLFFLKRFTIGFKSCDTKFFNYNKWNS